MVKSVAAGGASAATPVEVSEWIKPNAPLYEPGNPPKFLRYAREDVTIYADQSYTVYGRDNRPTTHLGRVAVNFVSGVWARLRLEDYSTVPVYVEDLSEEPKVKTQANAGGGAVGV